MKNIMSKNVILEFDDEDKDYEEVHLKEGREYEITIKAKFENANNLNLTFVSDLSNIVVNIDDIINIE